MISGASSSSGPVPDDVDLLLREIDSDCAQHLASLRTTLERALAPATDPADAQRRVRELRELQQAMACLADGMENLLRRTTRLKVLPEVQEGLRGHLLFLDIRLRRIAGQLRPRLVAVPADPTPEPVCVGSANAGS